MWRFGVGQRIKGRVLLELRYREKPLKELLRTAKT